MGSKYGGRRAMRVLDTVRAVFGPLLICHICGQQIIDHRFTGDCCRYPKALHWLTADHVIPRSRGGTDDISNVRPAHHSCNSKRQNKALEPVKPPEDSTEFFC